MNIACLGSGSGQPGSPAYDAMVAVGRLLAQAGHTVLTGGFGGAGMEAPARGAKLAGGKTVGYTILGKPGNSFLTEEVDCRTMFNICPVPPPTAQFCLRFFSLLDADGFIISAGGGAGSMLELMGIINLGAKVWPAPKKVAILQPNGPVVKGWDYPMLTQLENWDMLPGKVLQEILITKQPELAVNWATMVATASAQNQGPQLKL